MALFSKEMLRKRTLKNLGTGALLGSLSASGISAAILSANREEKKLKDESPDLRTKADIPGATYRVNKGRYALLPIPEKGRKEKRVVWGIVPAVDATGKVVKNIPTKGVLLPEGKHELSEIMKEYDTGKIDMTNLGINTLLGASLSSLRSSASKTVPMLATGVFGGMSVLHNLMNMGTANKYRRLANELEKDPNLSEAEREYLEKRKKKNYLLPALTAAAGLLGGASLGRAARSL